MSFDVPIIDDNIFENDESFTLTIRGGSLPNGVTRGSISRATVNIVDNDGKYLNKFYCLNAYPCVTIMNMKYHA